ncbi:MAG TPA: CocE/NonD family hydrolase, partial [Thermoanaerobaculia bacterium]|nr:CocE/NonD family hydrolase [Thermoanaerobaculia bacterium]
MLNRCGVGALGALAVLSLCCATQTLRAEAPPQAKPLPRPRPVEPGVPQVNPPVMAKHRVTFKSDDGLTLVGYLFVPPGPPDKKYPAIVWNHGSEKDPAPDRQFKGIADAFVPAGYAVFAPVRRGQGESQGEYISDTVAAVRASSGKDAAAKKMVELMETSQLGDQLAGLAFLRTQPQIVGDRIVVMGCSYGGIQTILGAESAKA